MERVFRGEVEVEEKFEVLVMGNELVVLEIGELDKRV